MVKQHLPIFQIARSKKLTNAEHILTDNCVRFLGRMATKVQGITHTNDHTSYSYKQIIENIHYITGAMLETL